MTTEVRFNDLLNKIPGGTYYSSQGRILPYSNKPTELRLITSYPNTKFLVLVNGVDAGIVITDVIGNALVSVLLPHGDITIELQRENSTEKLLSYVTTREYATWLASIAEQLESLDDSNDQTLNSFYLDKAGTVDIDLAHGVPLAYPNESVAELYAYREMLQLVRQSMRQFGGRTSGKYGVVAALTQVNPLILERYKDGPRWVLGYDEIFGWHFTRIPYGLLPNINTLGQFVTLKSLDEITNIGNGTLVWSSNFQRFKWTPPAVAIYTMPSRLFYYGAEAIDGEVTIGGYRELAKIDSLYLTSTPTKGIRDHLYLEFDNRGIVDIWTRITPTTSPTLPDGIISAFVASKYESVRIGNQITTGLAGYVEIINISDDTALGSGSIDYTAGQLKYSAPSDAYGTLVAAPLVPSLVRLISANGIDYVDIFYGPTPPSGTTSSFNIERRYYQSTFKPAQLFLINKLRLYSQHERPDLLSEVVVHSGPADCAGYGAATSREMFDIPRIHTSLQLASGIGATSIRVPLGASVDFNGVSGEPFDVVIGYGITGTAIVNTSVTPDVDNNTAVLEILAGGTFSTSDEYINFSLNSTDFTNDGVHKVLELITPQKVRLLYNGLRNSQPVNVTGVAIIKVDTQTINGGGTLSYDGINSITWQAPGDIGPGVPVNISSGGFFRVRSINNQFIDLFVNQLSLPGAAADTININKFILMAATVGATIRAWSNGEKRRVTSVVAAPTYETWNLDNALDKPHDNGMEVYLNNGQYPLRRIGNPNVGYLTSDIDTSFIPPGTPSDTVQVLGSTLPDNWLIIGAGGGRYTLPDSILSNKCIYVDDSTVSGAAFDIVIPLKDNMLGIKHTLMMWVRSMALNGISQPFRFGINFGSSWSWYDPTPIADPDLTVRQPALLSYSFIIPPNATSFKIRILKAGISATDYIIEKVVLVNYRMGLFLGHGTIPRSNGRSTFGSMLYIWSPDQLTTQEKALLGVGVPASGAISNAHNVHEQVEAWDVTDVVSGSVVNVRGVMTDIDWSLTSLTNLEVVSRTPSRFSYVKPSRISLVEEEITFTQTPPYVATLSVISDMNEDTTIIYENGVPLPNNQWNYNSATEVRITSGFVPGAIYTIEYRALIRLETTPIDLLLPPPNNDTWFADYVAWNRHSSGILTVRKTISILFDTNYIARLPRRSDQNKLVSVLTEDTGVVKRIVPQESWNYIDSLNIKMNGSEFNPDAIYTLEYNQRITDPSRVASIISRIKSANTVFGLGTASYAEFDQNDIINSLYRYHQIELTISNVIDIRDVRIHSVIIKGIRMYTPPVAPGL